MSNQFAKIFGPNEDQILVVFQEGEDGPEINLSIKPEGLGVCTMSVYYNNDDEGWEKAEKAFHDLDEDAARGYANNMLNSVFQNEQ